MKKYLAPKAEVVLFNRNQVLTASACNCIYDNWNEAQPAPGVTTTCDGDSMDAVELFGNDAIIPGA